MSNNLLKNRSFVYVWIGNAISELGGAFGTFCNSVLIYQLTGSTIALGSMWLLYFIPSLILQLFIGPFIDRWSRKWIMIFSQWTRGLIFLIPIVSLIIGNIEPWHIYVVQIIVGLVTPIYTPANQAITPTIVSKNHLSTANAYIDGTVRLMTFLAPVLGGGVVEYFGVKPTLIFVSILLIISGSFLIFIQETKSSNNVRKSWIEQFIEGVSFFFKQPTLVWLGIFLAFVQFGVGVTLVIPLPYITKVLSGSYSEYGYFMAGFPLGYVIGSLLVSKVKYKSRRVLMLGALVLGGLTFISLGVNSSIIFAFLRRLLQEKVSSVRLFIIRGTMPLGVFIGSYLGELWGIRPLYLLIGAVICTMSLLGILLPYFKFIDSNSKQNIAS